ncbi:MAG TPA: hypothetical protein VFE54_03975, partial [Mucilaginibacter sp.]|nr:hypothetical protein [Mucilaginibacter sp.]
KLWVRILISLLAGGMTNEIVFLSTGSPYRHRSTNDPNFTLLYALIIFLVLTWVVNKFGKKKYL